MGELLYTVPELAKEFRTSEAYVHDLRKSGLLVMMKLGHWKIRAGEVDKFLKKYEGWNLTDPYNPVDLRDICDG